MTVLQVDGGATILRISQKSNSEHSAEDQAEALLRQNPLLILDVSQVQLTSMQMGELVNLAKKFETVWASHAHRIGVLNLNPGLKEVFEKTKLTEIFDIYDSVSDAFNQFQQGTL